MTFLERVTSQYRERLSRSLGPEAAFRTRAWEEFESLGLPERQNESWRYSSVAALTGTPWLSAAEVPTPATVLSLRDRWRATFDVLVLVNGELRVADGVMSPALAKCVGTAQFDDEAAFGDGFVSLSAAVSRAGLRLTVPKGVTLERPVLVINAQAGAPAWAAVYNQIDLGENAGLDLGVVYVGAGNDSPEYLRTEVTQARLARGARLNWLRVQQDDAKSKHLNEAHVRMDADCTLAITQLNAGAFWSRNGIKVDVNGAGGDASVYGLTFGRDKQHIDQRIQVIHAVGPARSAQVFKGVLRDRARGILNGRILIARDAQKVASSQYNHNLLLSPGAEANTQPELEIYADDVKANHGASIGRLDEDKLFYLTSRGITRAEARRMLAHAFVADVLMKIGPASLRELAEARVRDILPEFV